MPLLIYDILPVWYIKCYLWYISIDLQNIWHVSSWYITTRLYNIHHLTHITQSPLHAQKVTYSASYLYDWFKDSVHHDVLQQCVLTHVICQLVHNITTNRSVKLNKQQHSCCTSNNTTTNTTTVLVDPNHYGFA